MVWPLRKCVPIYEIQRLNVSEIIPVEAPL
jgi:hypothetical protein